MCYLFKLKKKILKILSFLIFELDDYILKMIKIISNIVKLVRELFFKFLYIFKYHSVFY